MGVGLRVVAYNIHSSRDDRDALAAVVRGLEPDVLIMQEGPRRFRWRTKAAALASSFGLVVVAGGLPALGNVILTSLRVRRLDAWEVRFPLKPGRHMRGAAFARCSVGGVTFTLAGAHLSTDDEERPSQALLLRQALASVDGPVILGADLNDVPGSVSWDLVHQGRTDLGVDGGDTFPCRGPNRRIDTIAVSPSVGVSAYRVERGPLTLRASDHFPLVADLIL
ncbi:MAG: endonuclease [Hamadaea sp.]|uniref:endonuclease/exonuclease/phosphatase family protein n=1 Tax=Hamadaea sp. TaxID=2024425 RepID=UPI0017E7BFBB|nr:endonuclease/exonuclease/phosphatase family protein [Hamadaea sp.]NUR72610.1 endonuclease [Hamadaea sp.]NUT23095.1 endonuclease [Hamadaea sp.]